MDMERTTFGRTGVFALSEPAHVKATKRAIIGGIGRLLKITLVGFMAWQRPVQDSIPGYLFRHSVRNAAPWPLASVDAETIFCFPSGMAFLFQARGRRGRANWANACGVWLLSQSSRTGISWRLIHLLLFHLQIRKIKARFGVPIAGDDFG